LLKFSPRIGAEIGFSSSLFGMSMSSFLSGVSDLMTSFDEELYEDDEEDCFLLDLPFFYFLELDFFDFFFFLSFDSEE